MPQSYPELLEAQGCGRWVNMGVRNAGPDVYLRDPVLLDMIAQSDHAIVQVMGAANMSNPYYRVHPRRNDRFIAPEDRLTQLYPEVDFTGFHYTRHLLGALENIDTRRFQNVRQCLQKTWSGKMNLLLRHFPNPPTLIWISERRIERLTKVALAPDPVFVTRKMVDDITNFAATVRYFDKHTANASSTKVIVSTLRPLFAKLQ
jgi:hypothetical protein